MLVYGTFGENLTQYSTISKIVHLIHDLLKPLVGQVVRPYHLQTDEPLGGDFLTCVLHAKLEENPLSNRWRATES